MNTVDQRQEPLIEYERPTLAYVGTASEVILGLPGGGFDGPDGMTEPDFEFESDDERL